MNDTDSNTELNIFGPTNLLYTQFPGHVVKSSYKTVESAIKSNERTPELTKTFTMGQIHTSTGITLPEELQYHFKFFHY